MSTREAREFRSPEALRSYLREHPQADPARHTVKKPTEPAKKPEKPAEPAGKDDAVEQALGGLSKGERTRALEQALADIAAERGEKPKEVLKDLSKEGPGFEGLSDLSHADQKKLIEKALGEVEGERKKELEKVLNTPRPKREARARRIVARYLARETSS
jgi:hypothetical protein